jgi:hypothetical protein
LITIFQARFAFFNISSDNEMLTLQHWSKQT